MRDRVWLLVLATALTGCVVETDLARRNLPDAADAPQSATDSATEEANEEASSGVDGMAGMDGTMDCDGHDCEVAATDSGDDSSDGMTMP